MFRSVLCVSLFLSASPAAFSQTAAAAPEFEVASIKPAAPQPQGMVRVMMGGDAGRVDYTNVTLKNVVMRAYGVKAHQVSGPSWLDSERFDILAKIPEGVSRDQVPAMLQKLLADRFKMVVRRESKEQPVYALIVGKDGPKLKKSNDDDPNPIMMAGPGGAPPAPPRPSGGAAGGHAVEARTAVMAGPGGGSGPARPAGGMMMIGNGKVEARKVTMGAFADLLSNFLDRPVQNGTDIDGTYDISMEVSMEEMAGMRAMRTAMAGGSAPIGHSPQPGAAAGPAPDSATGPSIFTAVQQLGLKLEPRKGPIDFVVVDRAEKVPTEN